MSDQMLAMVKQMTGLDLAGMFRVMEWAEAEIAAAQKRHPDAAGKLWDTFLLVTDTHERMKIEWVYRPHARELLERVYADEDTRTPTDVELIIALMEASLRMPLRSDATTLYQRLFAQVFPDKARLVWAQEDLAAYERVHGDAADQLYREVKRKRLCPWRVYPVGGSGDRELPELHQLVFDLDVAA